MTATPDDMVVQCLPTLRASCAKVAAITGHDVDDLIGSALADYVLPQARRYDASRGVSLRSWVSSLSHRGGMVASRRMAPAGLKRASAISGSPHATETDELQHARARLRNHRYSPRLDAPIGDGSSGHTLHNVLSGAADDIGRDIDAARIRAALLVPPKSSVDPWRDAFVVMHRLDGETFAAIGERHGISREMVRKIISRAVAAVRERFRLTV